MERYSNIDRWRHNIPCARTRRSGTRDAQPILGLVYSILIAMLVVVGVAVLGALAHGQDRRPPEVIVFSLPACRPCQQLKVDVQEGRIGQRALRFVDAARDSDLYREFEAAVRPTAQLVPDGYVGQVNLRPHQMFIPIVWVRGLSHFWMGYTPENAAPLKAYLDRSTSPPPAALPRRPLSPASVAVRGEDEFEGVHVIVACATLAESLPELRAEAARRAQRILEQLTRTHVGSKVRASLVAQVSDPDRFSKICNAVGMTPSPAFCLVLVPQQLSGVKGLLVGRVHAALGEHFLVPLQQAGVHVILERLHGATYDAVLDVVLDRSDAPGDPFSPAEPMKFLAAAWLSERSNLARRLLARFGLAAA